MWRLMFGIVAATALGGVAGAQSVPGRDLLDFPIGTIADASVLATATGDGFWNPASIALPGGARGRASAGALHSSADQGVTLQHISGSAALPGRTIVGLSVVRASIDGLVRTDTDPLSESGEIPYSTMVVSLGAARRRDWATGGVALRYRYGEVDDEARGGLGIDGGFMVERLLGTDTRAAASTFLWRPAGSARELATFGAAADTRVLGADSLRQLRAGYGFSATERLSREHYFFTAGHLESWSARAGLARYEAFGYVNWRLRLGVGLHYARYVIGVGRDENGAGLPPTYQFTLSTLFP